MYLFGTKSMNAIFAAINKRWAGFIGRYIIVYMCDYWLFVTLNPLDLILIAWQDSLDMEAWRSALMRCSRL